MSEPWPWGRDGIDAEELAEIAAVQGLNVPDEAKLRAIATLTRGGSVRMAAARILRGVLELRPVAEGNRAFALLVIAQLARLEGFQLELSPEAFRQHIDAIETGGASFPETIRLFDRALRPVPSEGSSNETDLLSQHMELVPSIAATYEGRGASREDLLAAGNAGLAEAVGHFTRGADAFEQFARPFIEAAIRAILA